MAKPRRTRKKNPAASLRDELVRVEPALAPLPPPPVVVDVTGTYVQLPAAVATAAAPLLALLSAWAPVIEAGRAALEAHREIQRRSRGRRR